MSQETALNEWILLHLFPEDFFTQDVFSAERVLARRLFHWPLLEAIVHQAQCPVSFTRAELYRQVMKACGVLRLERSAYWFQVNIHDNCARVLEDLGEYPYPLGEMVPPLLALYICLEENPAEQGGTSYAGLLGRNKDWLLLFERGTEFAISLHGAKSFCDMVSYGLELPTS